jgi:hypothetical protein
MKTLKTLPALGITLVVDGGEFVMTGPTGRHTLAVSVTTQARLDAHFKGFVQAGIEKLASVLSDWDLLVACLGPTTAMFQLTTEDDERARVLCDGFGRMSAAMLWELEALFDWSHVRDSSPEAIAEAATFIRDKALSKATARTRS